MGTVQPGSGRLATPVGRDSHGRTRHALQPEGPPRHQPGRRRCEAAVPVAAAGCGIPIPGGTTRRRRHRRLIVIVLIFVLDQCMGGGGGRPARWQRPGAGRRGDAEPDGRHRALRQLQDRRRRRRPTTTARASAVENSLFDYWAEDAARAARHRLRARADEDLQRWPSTPAAARPPRRSARSTARPTSTIYLDTTFFARRARGQLGGQGGDFVEPYVLGHEYGHHIQNLLGTMGQVRRRRVPSPTRSASSSRPTATPACGRRPPPARRTRRASRSSPSSTEERHHRGARLRQGGRRRPDPAAVRRRGRPRGLDPRLGGAADDVVLRGLRPGHPRGLRHLHAADL